MEVVIPGAPTIEWAPREKTVMAVRIRDQKGGISEAGLREGDLIAGLDDVQFSSTEQMIEAWGKALEGEKTIHVLRGGKRLSFRVEMSKLRGRQAGGSFVPWLR